jgi:hypothetical protein
VMHERRYWFHLAPADPDEPQALPPARVLPAVGRAIETAGLLRLLGTPDGETRLFRAHTHTPAEQLEGARRLGVPPPEKAANNRMSPAGIPMFYGAGDPATAIAEVRAAETDPARSAVTVGVFEPTHDLLLVDLSDIPALPGLFDERDAYARAALRFLASFATDVSGAVQRDGRDHVDYVPTQVFSEWLRWEFKPYGTPIDGIQYRSAIGSGVCVALFIGPGSTVDDQDALAGQTLRLLDTLRGDGE